MEASYIAHLNSRYDGVEYIRIQQNEGSFSNGGNQNWWSQRTQIKNGLNYKDFHRDQNYRLWKLGCGIIAMCDAEIFLTQADPESRPMDPHRDIAYDPNTGMVQVSDYMSFIENKMKTYPIPGDRLHYITGLIPYKMRSGLKSFLKANRYQYTSVQWAPYWLYGKARKKRLILEDIERMLQDNLPVVFSYYSFDKNRKIGLYSSLESAIDRDTPDPHRTDINSHYMTIIGLYRYSANDSSEDKYILKVVSWGNIYYIRYDEYGSGLSYFSNILKIG